MNDVGHTAICARTIADAAAAAGIKPTIYCPANYDGNLYEYMDKTLPPLDSKELFIIHWLKAIVSLTNIFRLEKNKNLYLLYTSGLMGAFVIFFSKLLSGTKSKIVIVSHVGLKDVYPDSNGIIGQTKRFIARYVFIEPYFYMLAHMKNIYFASNCDTLIEMNARTFGMKNTFVLPIPHSLNVPLHSNHIPSRILYIGDSVRLEKGLIYLPELIMLAQKKMQHLIFINQISFSGTLKNAKIIQAKDELTKIARKHKKNVKFIVKNLGRDEYIQAIDDCDVVLLPYRRSFYQTSVSGVFSEAVSAGKWCIVPSRTWMSRQKVKYSQVSEFESYDAESMLNAIMRCRNIHVDENTTSMQIKAWRKEHSPENFIRVLLEKTGFESI